MIVKNRIILYTILLYYTKYKNTKMKGKAKKSENKSTDGVVLRKALLIGCNYAGTDSQLNGCINDIKNIKAHLLAHASFKDNEITMLSDHAGAKADELPTRKNIIKNIHNFVKDVPTTGKVVMFFHYSGHGSYTADLNGDEEDGYDETIVPLDYEKNGLLTDDDLKTLLVDTLPENVELYCIMDSCHSGTCLDLRYECRVKSVGSAKEYTFRNNKLTPNSLAKVILFSGCKDEQTSADAHIGRNYQGAMTWGFLEVHKQNKFQPMSYKTFLNRLQDLLFKSDYDQIPQLSSGKFLDLKEQFII